MKFYILFLSLALGYSVGQVHAFDFGDIVLALTFDEGKGKVVRDLSRHGNHGLLQGSPKWEKKGKLNSALFLDPIEMDNPADPDVDWVEIPNENHYDFSKTDSFTYAAWVKLSHKDRGDRTQHIIAKTSRIGVAPGTALFWDGATNFIGLTLRGDTPNAFGGWATIRGGIRIPDDGEQWHHTAAVYDGSKGVPAGIRLYVNGKRDGANVVHNTLGDNIILNDAPLAIGARSEPPGNYAKQVPMFGHIDEVLVFKTALSNAEIVQVFEGRVANLAVRAQGKLTTTWGHIKVQAGR